MAMQSTDYYLSPSSIPPSPEHQQYQQSSTTYIQEQQPKTTWSRNTKIGLGLGTVAVLAYLLTRSEGEEETTTSTSQPNTTSTQQPTTNTTSTPPTTILPTTTSTTSSTQPPNTPDYIINKDISTGNTVARDSSNNIIISNPDASTVINNIWQRPNNTILLKEASTPYIINTPLVPANYTKLYGEGSTRTVLKGSYNLNATSTQSIIQRTGSPPNPVLNVEIYSLEIDGSTMYRPPSYSTGNKGLYMTYCKYLKLKSLYVHDTPATGIGPDFHYYSEIDNCIAKSCGTAGHRGGSNGIGIGTGAHSSGFPSNQILSITNCTCINNKNYGIVVEGQDTTYKGYDTHISNCTLTNNYQGIRFGGTFRSYIKNSIIKNNVSHGISIGYSDVRTSLHSSDIEVSYNSDISNNGGSPIFIESGTNNITVTYNSGSGNSIRGIVNQTSGTVDIHNNNFT